MGTLLIPTELVTTQQLLIIALLIPAPLMLTILERIDDTNAAPYEDLKFDMGGLLTPSAICISACPPAKLTGEPVSACWDANPSGFSSPHTITHSHLGYLQTPPSPNQPLTAPPSLPSSPPLSFPGRYLEALSFLEGFHLWI